MFEPQIVNEVVNVVKDYGFENIYVTTAGSTISSHCGAGTLGVIFFKK